MTLKLYYIHDPMCSWCFAFKHSLRELSRQLPEDIQIHRLLGGLAPDSSDPMPKEMQQQLQLTWRQIEEKVPDLHFNYDFWTLCHPVRSTYPACRAVIASRMLNNDAEKDMDRLMTEAIQQGYYRRAENPSNETTLAGFAVRLGLNRDEFITALHSDQVNHSLKQEISLSRKLGIRSFPSLILQIDQSYWPISVDYLDSAPMLETISLLREMS